MKTTPEKITWLRDKVKLLDDDGDRELAEGICDDLEELARLEKGMDELCGDESDPNNIALPISMLRELRNGGAS